MTHPKLEAQRKAAQNHPLPKSVCICGHSGDGPLSGHHALVFAEGHGPCKECDCRQFTWADWTGAFQRVLDNA